jgi:hypothetical protein
MISASCGNDAANHLILKTFIHDAPALQASVYSCLQDFSITGPASIQVRDF